ncbi:MAG: lysophospholipid acyltransferase family protein [Planctomycetaceae bacterium]|jgi:KDO2-lipid IV(A) lauroyltransferase|nr:lysophospholipid acyltransferase family protein [Planctomycetaceae bacterium]
MSSTIFNFLVYIFVRVVFCIVQSLSLSVGHSFARGLAWVFTFLVPIRRRLLNENLMLAFPDLSAAERSDLILKMWEHLFLMGIEVSLARRKIRDLNWKKHIRITGASPLMSLLHQDRPVIIVTGHFGNFEIGGFSLGVLTYPSHTVARSLDNPFLNRFIKQFRESTGQFLIEKNGGSEDIINVLNQKGLMAFLVDQSAGTKGCMVDFFGKPASTFKAIALLALKFEAPIVICYSLRKQNEYGEFEPLQFDIHITNILDPANLPDNIKSIKDVTQWFTKKLENEIRKHPNQYWWIHRRWK